MKPVSITIKISDPALIAGIEHARDLYNATLPPVPAEDGGKPKVDEGGNPVFVQPTPGTLDSAGYLAFVMDRAVASYARQKVMADFEAGDMTGKQRDEALAALE